MSSLDVDHLEDHVRWLSAQLALPTARPDDASACVARILEAKAEIDQRASRHRELAAQRLASRLALSDAEMCVLWLLATLALSSGAPAALPAIQATVFGPHPSAEALRSLGPRGTLRRLHLIERADGGAADLHDSRRSWAIARRVLAWLHGDDAIDPELDDAVRASRPKPLAEVIAGGDAIEQARAAIHASGPIVVARGPRGLGKRTLLAAAAHDAGLAVIEIDAHRITTREQWQRVARECRLLARTPLVFRADDQLDHIGCELVPELVGPILITTHKAKPRWTRPAIVLELGGLASRQRARLWQCALPEASASDADYLAGQYPLAPAIAFEAAAAIRARARARKLEPCDVAAGISAVLDDRLDGLAPRVAVTQTWDDLVLPAEQLDAITELCARIGHRRTVYEDWGFAAKLGKGLGVTALFTGPPGTGKTMVAGLIARELGLALYQVDLARIASKYIGETEQHLAQLFDAAEATHAVLLFDEADALFGKRTEVTTSNDRYANLETDYLLQRLDSFTGVCILTSNHDSHLDPAFRRRLALHVRFEPPDEAERARLWQAMLPTTAPVAEAVDYRSLARRFGMPGGHIRNAALRAAFMAAQEGSAISCAHLERAAQAEAEAMGKIASGTL
jgi:hypothetical protein